MRLNRAMGEWNVEVQLANRSTHSLGAGLVLSVDSVTGSSGVLRPDGYDDSNPPKAYYDFSSRLGADGLLQPGAVTAPRLIALGMSGGVAPKVQTRVFGRRPSSVPLATVRTMDAAGLPLPSVTVEVVGPAGQATVITDDWMGLASVGQGAGTNTFKFSAAGYVPVWRRQSLGISGLTALPNPRLTRRSAEEVPLTTLFGGTLTNAGSTVHVQFAPGSFTEDAVAVLTPLDGQALPGLLPLGWSPLQAFWLELTSEPVLPGTVALAPWGRVATNETVALAVWNVSALAWEVAGITPGAGNASIGFPIPGSGAYVMVIGDAAPTAPPPPVVGAALEGVAAPAISVADLEAGGEVDPPTRPASLRPELVTALARVRLTNAAAAMPSGFLLRADVQERYRLQDGRQWLPPPYETAWVTYQRPGDNDAATLEATSPLRPVLLLGPEELAEAQVQVEVRLPAEGTGTVLDERGGVLVQDGIRVLAEAGDLAGPQAVLVRRLDVAEFADLISEGAEALAAFDLTATGLVPGRRLMVEVQDLPSNAFLVLARVVTGAGAYGLEPRERWATDAAGTLSSQEPANGERLPGVVGSGQYVVVRISSPQALVTGVAQDGRGEATGGLPVRVSGQPWLTFSRVPDGWFQLLAPVGDATLEVMDPATGDTGQSVLVVTDPASLVRVNPAALATGPSVVSITPEDGAAAVSLVTAVTVRFDKAVSPAVVMEGGIELAHAAGPVVPASVSLGLTGREVRVLPLNPLAGSTVYHVRVSETVTDVTGRPLTAAVTSTFTTESDALSRSGAGAELISYEPTNGLARIEGTQGFADPGRPVVLVNETTGRTSTVLAQPDGSFAGSIAMEVDDRVSAVVVNQNGTRNELRLTRQIFADGRVGLFESGGVLEAATPQGPLEVEVEPGAIEGKAVMKLEALSTVELLTLASNTPPESGGLLGGFTFRLEGEALRQGAHVAFPVDQSQLGLEPGESASNRVFALVQPIQVNGVTVYSVLDSMRFIDGKVVTHSPPFDGLMGAPGADLALAVAMWPYLASRQVVVLGFCVVAQETDAVAVQNNVAGLLKAGDPRLRPVPGAIVTATPGSAGSTKFGQRPGAFVSLANSQGAYRMLVGLNPLGSSVVSVRAESPRLPNIGAFTTVDKGFLSPLMTSDLVFRVPDNPGGNLDVRAPTVSADPPSAVLPTNTVVTVPFYVTDDLERPWLVSVVPDPTRSLRLPEGSPLDPVLVHPPVVSGGVDLGPTVTRADVTFQVDASALAAFKVRVSDPTGNERESLVTLRFGAPPAPPVGGVQATDPNDRIRPQVVWSLPSAGAILNPGAPVLVRFSEAMNPAVTNGLAVGLSGGLSSTLALSSDQQTLAITPVGATAGSTNTLTVNFEARDLNNNPLDQDPATVALEPFELSFRAPPAVATPLTGVSEPVGTVTVGIHHFTLERRNHTTGQAALVVHEGSNPYPLANLFLPPAPRSMALIPSYSFVTNIVAPNTNVTTAPLLAVVGGLTGEGNAGPWLRVVNLGDPQKPRVVGGALLMPDFTAAAALVKFDAPNLAVMTMLSNGSLIQFIDLQALLLGYNWPTTFGPNGPEFIPGSQPYDLTPGRDLNQDGDYVDDGEEAPIPQRYGLFGYWGAQASPMDRDFSDFDLTGAGSTLAATVNAGTNRVDQTNMTSRLQVLRAGGLTVGTGDDAVGAYELQPGERAFRVLLDPNLPVQDTTGVRLRSVALVCVTSPSGTWLDVVDLAQPIEPRLIRRIELVSQVELAAGAAGTAYSLRRSGPDEYLVALPSKTLVLRRSLLSLPPLGSGVHPALVANLLATTFTRSLGISDDYFSFSKDSEVLAVRRPPLLEVVRVPTRPVTNILSVLAGGRAVVTDFLDQARPAGYLEPTYVHPRSPECSAGLFPPSPDTHYYVLVHASGESGSTLKVAAQSLDASGRQIRPKGPSYPPVLLTGAGAGVRATAAQPAVEALTAHRLSDDPKDRLYNYYASDAFALLREPLTDADRARLTLTPERQVVWSGASLRLFLDVLQPQPTGLEVMSGSVAQGELVPGVGLQLKSLPGEYLDTPNPSVGASPRYAGVNLQSGEYRFAPTDLRLPGRLQDLVLTRCYESRSEYFGPFGRGWDFNWNARLVELPEDFEGDLCLTYYGDPLRDRVGRAGDVLLMDGGGGVQLFSRISAAAGNLSRLLGLTNDPAITEFGWSGKVTTFYASPPGQFSILAKFQDGLFVMLAPEGARTYFRADGRLDRLAGVYPASELVCAYREDGRLDRVIGDRGLELEFGYYHDLSAVGTRPHDRIASQTIEEGLISRVRIRYSGGIAGEVSYGYDQLGRLNRVQDLSGLDYVYAYDAADPRLLRRVGRLDGTRFPSEEIVYSNGLVSSVIRNGQPIQFGGAVATAEARYNTASAALSVQVGNAAPAEFGVDKLGRPTVFANRSVEANDDGRLTRVGDVGGQYRLFFDSTNAVYRFRANLLGTLQEGRASFATTNAYDGTAWNRPVRRVNTEGVETTLSYLSSGTPFVATVEEQTGPVLRISRFNEFGQMTNEVQLEAGHRIVRNIRIGPSLLPEGESYGSAPGATVVNLPSGAAGVEEGGLTASSTVNADGQPESLEITSSDPAVVMPSGSFAFTNGLVSATSFAVGASEFATAYTYDPSVPGRISQALLQETGLLDLAVDYGFDALGRVETQTEGSEITTYTHDGVLLTGVEAPGLSREVTFTGRAPTRVSENGVWLTLDYDGEGRLQTLTRPESVTEFTYNLGNEVRTKTLRALSGGMLLGETNTYDGAGRVMQVESAGVTRQVDYFADGEIRRIRLNGDLIQENERDDAGRLLTATFPDLVSYHFSEFNAVNGLAERRDVRTYLTTDALPPGTFREYTEHRLFDGAGRLRQVAWPCGLWEFTYDAFGHLTAKVDPDQVTERWTNSPSGLLLGRGFTDGSGVDYGYDANRRLERAGDLTVVLGGLNRLVEQITEPDGTLIQYANYNTNFLPERVTYGNVPVVNEYERGLVSAMRGTEDIEYQRDGFNRMTNVVRGSIVTTLGYDERGQLSREEVGNGLAGGGTFVWSAVFDDANHLESETYPSGLTIDWQPRPTGQPSQSFALGIDKVDWQGPDLVDTVVYNDGLQVAHFLDPSLRKYRVSYARGTNASDQVAGFQYTLTPGGRILAEQRSHEGRSDVFRRNSNLLGMRVTDFLLSATNATNGAGANVRVEGLAFTDGGEMYSPTNAVGSDARVVMPAVFLDQGRVTVADGQPVTYNPRGSVEQTPVWVRWPGQTNLTREIATLAYDDFGLIQVVTRGAGADQVTVTYVRDGQGRIVQRDVAGPPGRCRAGTRLYSWKGQQLIEEYERHDGTNALRRLYAYVGRDLVLVRAASAPGSAFQDYVPLLSLNGSIGGYLQTDGTLAEMILYGPYGTPVFYAPGAGGFDPLAGSAVAGTLLFQGGWYDEDTGLYEFGQRNLHPQLGRFLQRDNELYVLSRALFAAFNGDPVGMVDPLGASASGVQSDGKKLLTLATLQEISNNAKSLRKSAGKAYDALDETLGWTSKNPMTLSSATVDLADKALKFASPFGGEEYQRFSAETRASIGKLKEAVELGSTAFEFAEAAGTLLQKRKLVGQIEEMVLHPRGVGLARAWLERTGAGAESLGFEAGNYSSLTARALRGRRGVADSFRDSYRDDLKEGLFSLGKTGIPLAKFGLQVAYGEAPESRGVQQVGAVLDVAGKVLEAVDTYQELVKKQAEITELVPSLMRTPSFLKVEGLAAGKSLPIGAAASAVQVGWSVGFEGTQELIIAFADPAVAKAYKEARDQFNTNGGWLSVGGGVLATWGFDAAAYRVQQWADKSFYGDVVQPVLQGFSTPNPIIEFYMRGADAP